MYPFKSLMPSAAGSPVFRDILIPDPDQVMKHITSEISDIRSFEGFGRVAMVQSRQGRGATRLGVTPKTAFWTSRG